MNSWSGKVAVVTGASAGIGAAIVRELLRAGMIVVGLARRTANLEELAERSKDLPGKFHPMECDVSREESVVAAFEWIRDNLGSLDVLVNNAGVAKDSTLAEGDLEAWRAVLDVNVLGVCLCTREAVRIMREAGEDAVIVHVNSFAAERVPAVPGFGIYPASKRALAGLAQTLRHELTGSQIRVMSISPGLVRTELMSSFGAFTPEAMAATAALSPEDVAAALVYMLSTPRHVLVQDIVLRPVGENW